MSDTPPETEDQAFIEMAPAINAIVIIFVALAIVVINVLWIAARALIEAAG